MATGPFEIQMFINNKPYPSLEAGMLVLAKEMDIGKTAANKVFKKELKRYLNEVADILTKKFKPYSSGSGTFNRASGGALSSRSGKAAASIKKSVYVKGSSLANTEGGIGGLARLAPHEFGPIGGVIRGRNKHLTIPLKDALKPDGTPKKFSIREWGRFQSANEGRFNKASTGRAARSDKILNTLRTKAGNLLVYRKVGRRTEYLYVIIMPKSKGIKIQKRLGMGKTVQSRMGVLADRIAAGIQAAMFAGTFNKASG